METKHDDAFELAEALSVLAATPGTVRALLEGIPDDWLDFTSDAESWSAHTVLVHLIQNERTNFIPRARVILSGDAVRRFAPFHQLPEEGEFQDAPVRELLAQFADLRKQNLATLQSFALQPADYAREAEHPALGTVNLQQLLATWVVHDLNHLHQIAKSLASRYRDAVGPWKPNLAILE